MIRTKFERSEDGQTWVQVDIHDLHRWLVNWFGDSEAAIKRMIDGELVRTRYTWYRLNPDAFFERMS